MLARYRWTPRRENGRSGFKRVMRPCQWDSSTSVARFCARILPVGSISPVPFVFNQQPLRLVRSPSTAATTSMDRPTSASASASTFASPYSIPLPAGSGSWLYTLLAVLFTLLALEQSVYRYKKRHLPGAAWTIPIIGKFADSLKPTMEGYMRQWNAGDLSAVSVFNMSVPNFNSDVNLSIDAIPHAVSSSWPLLTNIHAKSSILRPTPSPVSSMLPSRLSSLTTGKSPRFSRNAPSVLITFRVFLTGKEHVAYRKALNVLFTRKALGSVPPSTRSCDVVKLKYISPQPLLWHPGQGHS